MCLLSGEMVRALIYEHGRKEFLRRVSDPNWFQAFSCTLGFDWHSSSSTTVTTAALKEALSPEAHGIGVAGGKGKTSNKAPTDIREKGYALGISPRKVDDLIHASKMSAKVDSALVQDGYQIYHHAFFFIPDGKWAVVQQGMRGSYARRYHWLSDDVQSFVDEPHSGICTDRKEPSVLDLTAKESEENRKATLDLARDGPSHLIGLSAQMNLLEFSRSPGMKMDELSFPRRHELKPLLDISEDGRKALQVAYELQPGSYEELVALKGMGPKKIRALALISDLIYGVKPCWKDPAKYSFAHGGKDGTPYPVDRETFDASIQILRNAIDEARVDKKEKYEAIKRLGRYTGGNA